MNWLASLTVRTKLIGSFLIVALIAAIIGMVGIRATGQVNTMAAGMHDIELAGLDHASRANSMLVAAGRSMRSALLVQTIGDREVELNKITERMAAVKVDLNRLDALFVTAAGKEMVARAHASVQEYEAGLSRVLAELKLEAPGQADKSTIVLMQDARPLGNAAEAVVGELLATKRANAERFAAEIADVYTNTVIVMNVLTAIGVLMALLLGWMLTRSLTRQLGGEPAQVAAIANAIAEGDLTRRIDTSHAVQGSVMLAMSTMQQSLRKLVASILSSSDSIATGANQIAAGNADLSQRTEEQAANLTETAAAMEELSSTVKSNADVAQQAAQRAAAASVSASKGGEVVNDVVVTMADINDSSKRIVDIIGVIDSIAFQTNILALNAAVEAARAGEQGRGFAVVASEVRSLAQKSAAAAKDVKTLIDESVLNVETGSKLVDSAGEAMQGIVAEIKQVTDLMSEISAATKEQTSGLGQINDAVLQLSDVTQQNAALVEESATASGSLSEQASLLLDTVSHFKVNHNERQPSVSVAAPVTRHAAVAHKRLMSKAPVNAVKEGEWEEF
ncbi:methyl-accepting chemotaxis protein [Pollutimonas bauzanensis]|uniref:methyl-accepting chemotaxis protein n=1 Tax=Pollutimonas bauzanensis TaxID=658167 RepID=UPI0033424F90